MNKILQTILIGCSILMLAWILPATYHFATPKKVSYPFTLYSSLAHDFLIRDINNEQTPFADRQGNRYTQAQSDSLLPTFYYRILITENRMPDTILGKAVTPKLLKKTNFFFRHSPRDVNKKSIPLYPLLESLPKRHELEMPDDVCRFTSSGVEFIDMETNRINPQKSELFQRVFQQKGVQMPINVIGGNPTARKNYDEGYFFTDSGNQLFHFKQIAGRPYLKKVETPDSIRLQYIFMTEFLNRTSFAFLTDVKNQMYVLTAPDYQLKKIGIPTFNPTNDEIFIVANMFDWTVKISNDQQIETYAINAANYSLIDSMNTPIVTTKAEQMASYIFPFELKFTSHLNKYFSPKILHVAWQAVFLHLLLAVGIAFIYRKQKKSKVAAATVLVLIFGVFACIPMWVFKKY